MDTRGSDVQQLMRLLDSLRGEGWDEVPLQELEARIAEEEIKIHDLRALLDEMVREGYLVVKHRLRGQLSIWPTTYGETLR